MRKYIYIIIFIFLSVFQLEARGHSSACHKKEMFKKIEADLKIIESCLKDIQINPANDPQLHNQFIRSVVKKERYAEEVENILYQDIMQKCISKSDANIQQELNLLYEMFILITEIKEGVDIDNVYKFQNELNQLEKLMLSNKASVELEKYRKDFKFHKEQAKG